MRRLAALASAFLALLTLTTAHAVELTSPDIELVGEEPVVATVNTSVLTVDFVEVLNSSDSRMLIERPMTCDLKVAQKFHGTRHPTTKKVSGDFDIAASTACNGSLGLMVVATLRRSLTDLRSTPVATCNTTSSGAPCTSVATSGKYTCNPCATGSYSTKSTHRMTIPANVYLVAPPPNCTMANATTVECSLTSSRTTIK